MNAMNDPQYLKRVRRHKRIVKAAGKLGTVLTWSFAYLLFGGIVLGLGEVGAILLTGRAFLGWQILGFFILVALPGLAAELFRPRNPR